MKPQEKFDLITRNLQEVIGKEEMLKILYDRDLKVYIGLATTGRPHIGYFLPMVKVSDFLQAGCKVKILFADMHAYLDDQKSMWDQLSHRMEYYEFVIKELLKSIGAPIEKLEFVKGTDYQLDSEYTLDVYKLTTISTVRDLKKAGAEVVKQSDNPKMGSLLYPILQALDEQYLGVDAQFGGVDQRKIFMFAREYLEKIGYKKRIHLMNPMLPSLRGDKMSSSVLGGKIDLLDSDKEVIKKMNKCYCPEGEIAGNGVLMLMRNVIFPILENSKKKLVIERSEKYGGNIEFKQYQNLEDAYVDKKIHPVDLKGAVGIELNKLLEPIRKAFNKNKKLQSKMSFAYP
ncbi:MAG: tyrosine--tRNA ligase [Nanoarchaeota archaeon]|nr:tyrosine--tRNA ligase [Nanoarchaeota archaeon]